VYCLFFYLKGITVRSKLCFVSITGIFILSFLSACSKQEVAVFPRLQQLDSPAPMAQQQKYTAQYHGLTVEDNYHWLKDASFPEVSDPQILTYLEQENDYLEKFLAPHQTLVDKLFAEFKGREDDSDSSVPWQYHGYEYRWYYRAGEEYRTWVRRKLDSQQEEVFLDETQLAKQTDYFDINDWDISPDNRYLAYSVDVDGSERTQIKIVDLSNNQYLPDILVDAEGQLTFSNDSTSLIYTQLEPGKWRTASVNLHTLGQSQEQDRVLAQENDEEYSIGFELTSSEEFLIITSENSKVTQASALPMADLSSKAYPLVDKQQGFLAKFDHGNGHFYILANDTHINFRLAKVDDSNPQYANWQTVIAGSQQGYLINLQTFKDFIAINQSINGLESIQILPNEGEAYVLTLPEDVASVSLGASAEFAQSFVRINYGSMITPSSVYDYDIATRTLVLRKVKQIPSGYEPSQYQTKRVMAPSRDGLQIPVTLVYKKGFKQNGSQPLYLYGYGAYGLGISPYFSSSRLSLLDRGFVYAVAHVRGGDELGQQWYLEGKLEKRSNTFNDFIDVAQFLIEQNYASQGNISIGGRSAGGELVGAAVIQAPELWRSANLGVPFVDVLNTMLDAKLPLTPPEWSEWGNPLESKTVFEFLQSYSPYDNIQAREYPPMIVTGGLNDPRVTYWEPAKWTAKMRATKTDSNLLVMRINMGAGHFANSGRYGRLEDSAQEMAFTLVAHGITK
jgi:oligopeptidase B